MWEEIGGRTVRELDAADPVYRRWMLREMRAHRFLAYLAVSPSGEIGGSGAVWLQPIQPRPGPVVRTRVPYLLSMFTDPSVRGQQIASRLVIEMVRWAERRGYRRVVLHASTAGRPVYEKLGFVSASEMRLELPAPMLRGDG
jgi:GNAT superfamily N-acetyltransferase